jgi:RHS repeat-associated protein
MTACASPGDIQQTRCIERDFPGAYLGMDHQLKRQTLAGPTAWMGSLVQDGQDASGLSYRRNRYYDANSGRFTQEDPIGIAGGLNVYGFGKGDPVTYSDPYGLCPPENLKFDCSAHDWWQGYKQAFMAGIDEARQHPLEFIQRGWHPAHNGRSGEQHYQVLEAGIPEGVLGEEVSAEVSTVFRSGKANPGNFRLRPGEEGVSVRTSLSNPVGSEGSPVFRSGDSYVEIETAKLPRGSLHVDNTPPGHAEIRGASAEQIKDAARVGGKIP